MLLEAGNLGKLWSRPSARRGWPAAGRSCGGSRTPVLGAVAAVLRPQFGLWASKQVQTFATGATPTACGVMAAPHKAAEAAGTVRPAALRAARTSSKR